MSTLALSLVGTNEQAPPFSLKDMQQSIPAHLWEKNAAKSLYYLAKDVVIVAALAGMAITLNNPLVWPLYWLAQGTMFWALFVIGHDCGHNSFSNSRAANDVIGNIVHTSIMVPYHGWRISHRTHHSNHGTRARARARARARCGRSAEPCRRRARPRGER